MEPKNNTEVRTNAKGNMAAVFVTDPGQVSVSCYVDWTRDQIFIRRKVFKTRTGAEKCAEKFFAGLR